MRYFTNAGEASMYFENPREALAPDGGKIQQDFSVVRKVHTHEQTL
jgi:hypothetical protein